MKKPYIVEKFNPKSLGRDRVGEFESFEDAKKLCTESGGRVRDLRTGKIWTYGLATISIPAEVAA